jgi:hypothetical protein
VPAGAGVPVAVRVAEAVGELGLGAQVGQGVVVGQDALPLSSQAAASAAAAKPITISKCFMERPLFYAAGIISSIALSLTVSELA